MYLAGRVAGPGRRCWRSRPISAVATTGFAALPGFDISAAYWSVRRADRPLWRDPVGSARPGFARGLLIGATILSLSITGALRRSEPLRGMAPRHPFPVACPECRHAGLDDRNLFAAPFPPRRLQRHRHGAKPRADHHPHSHRRRTSPMSIDTTTAPPRWPSSPGSGSTTKTSRRWRRISNAILGFIEQLGELDVDDVEPDDQRHAHAAAGGARTWSPMAVNRQRSSPTRRMRAKASSPCPRWWS